MTTLGAIRSPPSWVIEALSYINRRMLHQRKANGGDSLLVGMPGLDADHIAPGVLGAVQGLVCRLDHFLRIGAPILPFGHADADGD